MYFPRYANYDSTIFLNLKQMLYDVEVGENINIMLYII